MKINNFLAFKVGTVFNKLFLEKECIPYYKNVCIQYPARLNAMAIDPSGITENHNMTYSPGEIVFSTCLTIEVEVSLLNEDVVIFKGDKRRTSVVNHTCQIMKQALKYDGGFEVEIRNAHSFRHCGLGSTGSIQAAIGVAINYLFGNPILKGQLIRYLAQNYGEEIDGDDENLMPIQCIGGSAASGIFEGGVLVLAGENTVIAKGTIGEEYTVILGIPEDYVYSDSKSQFEEEEKNIYKFLETGNKYKNEIAYSVLHKFLPAVINEDLKVMGDVIFEYRYNKGSIKNCDYTYAKLPEIMENLKFLKLENHVDVLSISSVGPLIFAIGKDVDLCEKEFNKNNLKVFKTKINNESFKVLRSVKIS